ncbi:hypothetical protein G6011_04010 [Alternaria panax]|uniref:Glucose-methanol-choline oxidoreductase N-terminal domain-containing protein n=1 Tax=Alternaria panax TaxID=48097 RepID=A0AAD4NUJ9_9PLEO|nr:hypothetical protein G6011_04010 [Alternaria panax]
MANVIIIGGGIAGTVIASRLHERKPSLSIVLTKAGPDLTGNPYVTDPAAAANLHFSEFDYNYSTTPQEHLDGKPRRNVARDVDDQRWTYEGLLPYFKRTEKQFDAEADPSQNGHEGPMHTAYVSSTGRQYPLRDTVSELWTNLGIPHIHGLNDGCPQGICDLVENFWDGMRQTAQCVFLLQGVQVRTSSFVRRVLFDDANTVVGVELTSGETIELNEGGQVIVSAGAYQTPQVVMLSGVGDLYQLVQHNIPVLSDLPTVEKGLAIGSPLFGGPNYENGGPVDFLVRAPIPTHPLKSAIEKDEGLVSNDHLLFKGPRTRLEMLLMYIAIGAESQVTLASSGSSVDPAINPNYYTTESDRHVMREGSCMQMELMLNTAEDKELVESKHFA